MGTLTLYEFHDVAGLGIVDVYLDKNRIYDATIKTGKAVTISGISTISGSFTPQSGRSGFFRSLISGCDGFVLVFVMSDYNQLWNIQIIEESFFRSLP